MSAQRQALAHPAPANRQGKPFERPAKQFGTSITSTLHLGRTNTTVGGDSGFDNWTRRAPPTRLSPIKGLAIENKADYEFHHGRFKMAPLYRHLST